MKLFWLHSSHSETKTFTCLQMWDLALVLETAHDTLHVSNMLQAYATQVHSGRYPTACIYNSNVYTHSLVTSRSQLESYPSPIGVYYCMEWSAQDDPCASQVTPTQWKPTKEDDEKAENMDPANEPRGVQEVACRGDPQ